MERAASVLKERVRGFVGRKVVWKLRVKSISREGVVLLDGGGPQCQVMGVRLVEVRHQVVARLTEAALEVRAGQIHVAEADKLNPGDEILVAAVLAEVVVEETRLVLVLRDLVAAGLPRL
jgi:hypothetical protein